MKRFSDRHNLHTLAELNVTPLLDLAFVLLIIFMITTPLMEHSLDVVLPSGAPSPQALDPQNVETVVLHKDQRITLGNAEFTLTTLPAELERLHALKPQLAVVIRSHKELPVQLLVNVMDAAQHAHIAKVGVVTQAEEP